MLILSQCMDLKSMMTDLGYELKILICLVVTVLALSLLKAIYYHFNSAQNVRKIRQILDNSRSTWKPAIPADITRSGRISPLPHYERVPARLSLRRRSSLDQGVNKANSASNSSNDSVQQTKTLIRSTSSDSLKKMQLLKPETPPSRHLIKSSTTERKESPSRRRKNQIITAEMLM
jgi:hypothetical protein